MRQVANAGSDRVLDLLRPALRPNHQLDLATSALSIFSFGELSRETTSLHRARLIIPDESADLALLGGSHYRHFRNSLRGFRIGNGSPASEVPGTWCGRSLVFHLRRRLRDEVLIRTSGQRSSGDVRRSDWMMGGPIVCSDEFEGTKRRLLDAAEKLFSERGPSAVSIRELTAEAGANVAAVNYHFRDKESLLRALCSRRIEPLQARRIELLELAVASAGESSPDVRAILHAFVEPAFGLHLRHPEFLRVLAHLLARAPQERAAYIDAELIRRTIRQFANALGRAFPEAAPSDLYWGLAFIHGALMNAWGRDPNLGELADGAVAPASESELLERLVDFAAGGLWTMVSTSHDR